MLNKLLENYKKLSFEKEEELINVLFVMFYGGEKQLISRLNELKEESNTDEEIFEILKIETNFNFWLKVSEILQFNNISDLIESTNKLQFNSELASLITDHEGLTKMFAIQKSFAEYVFATSFDINLEGKTREESKILLKRIAYVTKETIAAEFKCNKRTLKKWLKIYFGDRFVRKDRKITMEEYIEIFEAFFLSDDEKLNLNNDLSKYLKRLQEGINFNKSDLALLCDSDLKTQRENLKKIAYFSYLDKFPYSICKNLASQMGHELEF
ncbi:hypothetical protein [Flavobacterium humidisoli]|uniref:Uncharacterized protein n=1 Tax=Flavobacterium humidisoli TaxID=2937442 RepID=A0ABY4LT42_9FLAO|nr:hypothetical protein [Flavobacterium humidisoli]UPZ16249.1 hypothetical protein M0M44_02610 [Flavobacterium humidisoli]